MPNRLLLVLVALTFACCLAPAPSGPKPILPAEIKLADIATDATDPHHYHDAEPSIAVNPRNSKQIAVVAFSDAWAPDDPGVRAAIWWSKDGGTSWKKEFQIPRPKAGAKGPIDQKLAFDSNGRLWVAQMCSGAPPRCYIYSSGNSLSDPLLLRSEAFGFDQPHLETTDDPKNGTVWVSSFLVGADHELRARAAIADGKGPDVKQSDLGDATGSHRTTRVAATNKGKVYAVYKSRKARVDADYEKASIWIQSSTDSGKTWNKPVKVQEVVTLFTSAFGNRRKGKVGKSRSSDAWVAVGPVNGRLFVAYIHRDKSGRAQVFAARSVNDGANWKHSRVSNGKFTSSHPEIAVTANGVVGVLYVDYDDSGQKTIFRHRFAACVDDDNWGKVKWEDRILQSMDPGPLENAHNGFLWGDYEGLVASANVFYGVFAGESLGRENPELDPIFFKVDVSHVGKDSQ